MSEGSAWPKYKIALRDLLGAKAPVFLYWKGRVALYAILKAMGVGPGDEVILPAFTCVVVPNAIMYLGAKPVYVDIRPDTYCMNPDLLQPAFTDRTKAILCQNTFGLSAEVDTVVGIAKERGIRTVEDCAHGFGGSYRGKANGTWCDAAFFSTQWNKPFSTGLGGFAVVSDPDLAEKVEALEAEKSAPGFKEAATLRLLLLARKHLLRDWTYWSAVSLYRWLSRRNLILGSSQGEELEGVSMPRDYFKGMSGVQAAEGVRALCKLDARMDLRRRNAEIYTDFLKERGKAHVPEALFGDHAFLKYPLRVRERQRFMEAAERSHVRLGDWFVSPIHPVPDGLDRWEFDGRKYPVASEMASKTVNLPTDTLAPEKALAFLEEHMDVIE